MRPRDRVRGEELCDRLLSFDRQNRRLPGIQDVASRGALVEQLLESIRRVKVVSVLQMRELSPQRANPESELFDPLRAAILQQRDGNVDEAFWLVFLFAHFGKHQRAGWRYAREVYGRLGSGQRWDWPSVSANPKGFRNWLHDHRARLERPGIPRGFGNHRKYESLDAYSENGTGAAVESYVRWVGHPRTHRELIAEVCGEAIADGRRSFDELYRSMAVVRRFGRTARFDYLTMVGKLQLAPIEPGSTYMHGATGPVRGAQLLFAVKAAAATLDEWLAELDASLHVGMQVLEDSLCNWQKSPGRFVPFRG